MALGLCRLCLAVAFFLLDFEASFPALEQVAALVCSVPLAAEQQDEQSPA